MSLIQAKRLAPIMRKGFIPSVVEGDDIVHPLKKFEDKCNRSVVGSNPTRGANVYEARRLLRFVLYLQEFFLVLTLDIPFVRQGMLFE